MASADTSDKQPEISKSKILGILQQVLALELLLVFALDRFKPALVSRSDLSHSLDKTDDLPSNTDPSGSHQL